jgi:hypothetical protein
MKEGRWPYSSNAFISDTTKTTKERYTLITFKITILQWNKVLETMTTMMMIIIIIIIINDTASLLLLRMKVIGTHPKNDTDRP